MTVPTWAPTLPQVAIHTRRPAGADDYSGDYTDDYSGDYAGTFTSATTPTDVEATEHIAQACIKVIGEVGLPVIADAEDACRVAAAWWAAFSIEVAREGDTDSKAYDELRKQGETTTSTARILNYAGGGGGPGDMPLVVSSFPPAPPWADILPGRW